MAYVNGLEDYMKWVNNCMLQDGIDIDTELVENCGHGNHENFFQGTLSLKDIYDPQDITNYFVVGYDRQITSEQIEAMLTKSTYLRGGNNPKNINGIEDQGCGIKVVFLQKGDETFISTRDTYERTKTKFCALKWDIKRQYDEFKKKMCSGENKDGTKSFNVNMEAKNYYRVTRSKTTCCGGAIGP